MTEPFEAYHFIDSIVVWEVPTRRVVESGFETIESARTYAEALTRWHQSRPTPTNWSFYGDHPTDEPHLSQLFEMIDRIYDAEVRLDLLSAAVTRATIGTTS